MTDPVAMGEHYRPTEADLPAGVYRVVGTSDGVTLLRVGDADGRRVNTGEVRTVDSLAGFAAAENPDGNRSTGAKLFGAVRTGYWQLRTFAASLAARPLPAAAFGVVLLAGAFGPRFASQPELLFDALVFTGALGLAALGSGRL